MNYEIVTRPEETKSWREIISPIPEGQALKIVCLALKEVRSMQSSIRFAACHKPKIRLTTRVLHENDKFILYIWKLS